MAQIVLVHGIAQEQRAADALENEWLPALAGGVRLAGYPNIADQLWRDRSGPGGIDARKTARAEIRSLHSATESQFVQGQSSVILVA